MTTPRPYRLRTSRTPWSRWAGIVFAVAVAASGLACVLVYFAPQIVAWWPL